MFPSRAGSAHSANGSASASRGIAGHGSGHLGSGLRPVLAKAGQSSAGFGTSVGVGVGAASGRQAGGRSSNSIGMLGSNGPPGGSRGVRTGNGTGLTTLQPPGLQGGLGALNVGLDMHGGTRYERDNNQSGSENDSDSGEEDDQIGSIGDSRRGVKRERCEMEAAVTGQEMGVPPGAYGMVPGGVAGAKPGKKTRGRVKIKMEFIDNKLRRYTTFSKRKTGIMKKAYELSTLTGTQVLLLVASETGHVYTFATRKLQPMITSETGKALIQTCLNSPDSPPRSDPSTDQRMSATGFEETDLTYQVSESESMGEGKDTLKPAFTVASLPGGVVTSGQSTVPTTSTSMQVSSSFPITNYLAPVSAGGGNSGANGTLLKAGGGATSGVMQLPGGFTFMPAGTALPPGTPTIPLSQLQHHSLALAGQHAAQGAQAVFRFPAAVSLAATASMPANIVTTSGSAGHMMYPSPHTVMYTSSPALTDGGLAVLNAFSQGSSSMHVSHGQGQDSGGVPQVFLAAPPGSVQIPVSAVQLHPMVIGQQSSGSSSTLTELKVVNLDAAQGSKGD
ncbi:serum response factor b isoform X1 [Gadus morhua]|uniref:serum response factor b isoform X1 n=1 Tax=Gadus morhua TaxID=8049 RepID=UPI0011B69AFF|nr:serum response factor isoform X1 [Gadus morhua]